MWSEAVPGCCLGAASPVIDQIFQFVNETPIK
jgi:hypothetical protein